VFRFGTEFGKRDKSGLDNVGTVNMNLGLKERANLWILLNR
jgi:hypothetical protein